MRTLLHLLRLLVLVVLLGFAFVAGAQDFSYTTFERTEGQRTLKLTGILVGVDSAYLQLYHDGDALLETVVVNTWDLTLGTFDYYVAVFTDQRGREKRIYIIELSDDLVEFYPPVEVDFDRRGNLLLLKQSDGKPHWQEFDTGLSRKRK